MRDGIRDGLQVNDNRGIPGHIPAITDRGVDESAAAHRPLSVRLVNVAEQVEAELSEGGEPLAQRLTSSRLRGIVGGEIEDAMGWTMRDEDVHVFGNKGPFLSEPTSAVEIEGPVPEPGLPGAAPDLESLDLDAAVAQVGDVGRDECFRHTGIALEEEVVIAGDEELVLVRETAEPNRTMKSVISETVPRPEMSPA